MTRHVTPWARRAAWQLILALLAFVQVAGTLTILERPLYTAKLLGGLGISLCFLVLGRCRVSRELTTEFALVMATIVIGLVTQLSDTIDARAVGLAASYGMTASTAFLLAPSALRRRSVQRIVWPALLLGVTVGTLLGEYIGLQNFLASFTATGGRLRFAGGFYHPNAAGMAGLIGVTLAVTACEATRRWRYLATVPFFFIVMLLADSRGSVLAAATLLAAFPILAIARWPPRRRAVAVTLGTVAFLWIGGVVIAKIDWSAVSQFGPELNRVSSGRWYNWQEALGYLDSPLRWMFGLGMSRNLSFTYQATDSPVPVRGSNADNFFIDILGRTGIVGLILIMIMIASLTLKMWRGLRLASPRGASHHVLAMAVLASTIILGGTNSLIFTWSWLQAMVAWPLVAAAATRPIAGIAWTPRVPPRA